MIGLFEFQNFIELHSYIFISLLLFFTSLIGLFITRHNVIIILMAIELLFLSITLNFVVFSLLLDDNAGQFFAIFVLTVAAAESSIGLAILLIYYRIKNIISTDFISLLKS